MSAPLGVGANMRTWAREIEHLLAPLAAGHLRDINADSSGIVFMTGTPYYWSDLPAEAHAHQARTLEQYRRFSDTLRVLIREVPDDRLAKFQEDTALVTRFICREASSYATPGRALEEAGRALRRQVELMDGLYGASTNTMLVPDTNALYWNTALDTWRLPWGLGPERADHGRKKAGRGRCRCGIIAGPDRRLLKYAVDLESAVLPRAGSAFNCIAYVPIDDVPGLLSAPIAS